MDKQGTTLPVVIGKYKPEKPYRHQDVQRNRRILITATVVIALIATLVVVVFRSSVVDFWNGLLGRLIPTIEPMASTQSISVFIVIIVLFSITGLIFIIKEMNKAFQVLAWIFTILSVIIGILA